MSGPRLLVGAGLGLLLFTAALNTPADADLWGHLTFGRDIIATGHVFQADRYAFTSDRPWINHEWLTEVSLAAVYGLAGPAGLVALKLAIIAALLLLIWRHLRRLHPSAAMSVALIAFAFVGTFWRTHAVRPQLFSVLFFAILLVAMARAGEGRWRSLLIVPPLFALWVNLHGGWIVGLGVFGLWTLVQIVDRRLSIAARLILAAVGLASAAATLLNPHGLQMWTFLGDTVRLGRDDIEEWRSILTHPVAVGLPWLITLVAAGSAFWRSSHVRRFDYAAIVLLLALLSFRVSRLDAFFSIAVVILLAPGLVDLFRAPSVSSAPSPPALPPRPPSAPRLGVVLITASAAVVMLWSAAPLIAHYASCIPVDESWTPEPDAARFITRNRLQGRMLTWFDWGEYAIWHFGPALRVSMDGRRETVYTAATIQAHRRFYADDETALSYLRDLNPDYIWLPTRLPIVGRLTGAGWTTIFSGPVSAVLARAGAGPFQDATPSPVAVRCFPGP